MFFSRSHVKLHYIKLHTCVKPFSYNFPGNTSMDTPALWCLNTSEKHSVCMLGSLAVEFRNVVNQQTVNTFHRRDLNTLSPCVRNYHMKAWQPHKHTPTRPTTVWHTTSYPFDRVATCIFCSYPTRDWVTHSNEMKMSKGRRALLVCLAVGIWARIVLLPNL